jgi:predicted AlkP superfamily phosphohydrolase/phosphomutase
MIAVLQFDSASVTVVERMLAAGRLPHLAALRERGRHHELEGPARDFAAGAFYSLYSGVEIADHGIYYPFQWVAGEQRVRYAGGLEAPEAVWDRLGRDGARTLAIDPYESRPPNTAEGVFVCGFGFTERVVLPRWSRPKGEGRKLERLLGRPPHATEIFGAPSPRRLLALRRHLVAAPARVADAALHHLERDSFDLAWLTFSASHLAGHQFWDLSQLGHGKASDEQRLVLGRALEEVYGAVDTAIGRVVAALPADCDLIVTSPVGMDVNASWSDLLPEMLAAVLAGGAVEPNGSGSIWRLRAAMPPGARDLVARGLPDAATLALTSRLELRGHHWPSVEAFAHPADNQGYIRLNLRGRERDGIVDPSEAEALIGRIADGLSEFQDPRGVPVVAEVARVADEYSGEHVDRLPDLVVRWTDLPSTTVRDVWSHSFGVIARRGAGSGRSGNHTPGDAWAVVVPGASGHREPSRPPRLIDIAATVAEVTGSGAGEMTGEPLLAR